MKPTPGRSVVLPAMEGVWVNETLPPLCLRLQALFIIIFAGKSDEAAT